MSVLDKIRTAVPANTRERLYVIVAAVIALLVPWGVVSASTAPAWAGLAFAVITLAFAILHSTSTVRTAIYSTLLAVQGVAQLYGILTDTQWTSIAGLAAAVLGLSVAAAKTPTVIDGDVVSVTDHPIDPPEARGGAGN